MSPQTTAPADAPSRDAIASLHAFDRRPARNLGPMQLALLGLAAAAVAAWRTPGFEPLLLLIWPAAAFVLLQFAFAFHDAGHGRFHPGRRHNDFFGHAAGTLSLVPLAAYRHAHARHHAYLGTPRDPELWPFTVTGVPRWLRVTAAVSEIAFAAVHTPLLFLRGVLAGGLPATERRRVAAGYALCVAVWAAGLAAVHAFGLWEPFAVAVLVPYALAASAQTVNKYAEHLGLHGKSVLGLTRTVDPAGPAAAFVSDAVLHVDAHGTHHRYAKIPHYHLPAATPYALAGSAEPCPVFPSLWAAVLDMLPCLADPKVGPQWAETADPVPAEAEGNRYSGRRAAAAVALALALPVTAAGLCRAAEPAEAPRRWATPRQAADGPLLDAAWFAERKVVVYLVPAGGLPTVRNAAAEVMGDLWASGDWATKHLFVGGVPGRPLFAAGKRVGLRDAARQVTKAAGQGEEFVETNEKLVSGHVFFVHDPDLSLWAELDGEAAREAGRASVVVLDGGRVAGVVDLTAGDEQVSSGPTDTEGGPGIAAEVREMLAGESE